MTPALALVDVPPADDLLAMALRALGFKPHDVRTLVERAEGDTLDARIRSALALARGVTKVAAASTKVVGAPASPVVRHACDLRLFETDALIDVLGEVLALLRERGELLSMEDDRAIGPATGVCEIQENCGSTAGNEP